MTIAARFRFWIAIVVLQLLGTPAWVWASRLVSPSMSAYATGAGWIVLGGTTLLMAALLWTTPIGAIRLTRDSSHRFILLGTAWLCLSTLGPAWRGQLVLGVVLCLIAYGLLRLLAFFHASPWWAAVWVWNPVVIYALSCTRLSSSF